LGAVEPKNLLLAGAVKVKTLLSKERYGDSLSPQGSNTQLFN